MGGQQFCEGGLLVDTRSLAGVLDLDAERGLLDGRGGHPVAGRPRAPSAARRAWRAGLGWSIAQKQTGADRLSLGGALAANVHGRGLAMPPFVADVEQFTLVTADGEPVRCSRTENAELFALVAGGYGLFGVVSSALAPPRAAPEARAGGGARRGRRPRVAPSSVGSRTGFLYGDFQFAIDPADDDFLTRGVFSCYRPVADDTPIPAGQRALSRADWAQLHPPGAHGQGAGVPPLRRPLPAHDRPGVPLGRAPVRGLRRRLPRPARRGHRRPAPGDGDDHRGLRPARAARRLHARRRRRLPADGRRCHLRHDPADRARRRDRARLGARALGVRHLQPPHRAHGRGRRSTRPRPSAG